jgi:two-component system, sensor histidine kinase and response regulator
MTGADYVRGRFAWVRRHAGAIVLAAASATGLTWFAQRVVIERHLLELQIVASQVGFRMTSEKAPMHALGAAKTLGAVSERIRVAAKSAQAGHDPALLRLLETLVATADVETALIVDRHGIVVEYFDRRGLPFGGLDVSSRPHIRAALAGQANIYPAYGRLGNSLELYVAAPIRAEDDSSTAIVGVLVLQTTFERVAATISDFRQTVLVVSPEDRVFASNTSRWLFARLGPAEAALKDDVERLPERLGASGERLLTLADGRVQRPDGLILRSVTSAIDWPDLSGSWRVVLLGDEATWFGPWAVAGVWSATFLGALAVCLAFERRLRRQREAIVEQHALEARRRDSEQDAFMAAVLNASPIAFQCSRGDGPIEVGNTAFRELYEMRSPDLGGVRWSQSFARAEDFETLTAGLAGQNHVIDFEHEAVRTDGSRFWGLCTVTRVMRGGDAMLCSWTSDITERKALETQLIAAREVAEQATRMKSDFLANMSHEIRTPMNAILGMAQLLLKDALTPRQKDHIEKVLRAGRHLLGLINDVLDFSKIEAGKLSLEAVDFDLDQVLDNISELIAEKASDKGLELLFLVDEAVPRMLVGDPLRIGQILINYANNAIKFTERGEINIAIRVLEESPTDLVLHCSVRDTGIGLSEEETGRLFRAFQQADASTTRRFGGTGLGLAICKRLAELMGGDVGLTSLPGVGSTFWFTARLGRSSRKPRLLVPDAAVHGRRILVVDDHDHARGLLAQMLSSMAFRVSEATSGATALHAVRNADATGDGFDLIAIDWQMPVMDGIQTARLIDGMVLSHRPRVILVTAHSREDALKGAKAAGIEAVLIKPINPSLMFDTIMNALGHDGAAPLRVKQAMTACFAPDLTGGRVLLVEDNDVNQEVAKGLMEAGGLVVDVAENGAVALAQLASAPDGLYAAVLMDMQMPVMDGITATRELRNNPRFASLPIIAMTANAMTRDVELCRAAGMNDHIAKPLEEASLWSTLSRWIAPQTGGGALVDSTATAAASPEGARGWEAIPGLDSSAGLRRVRRREETYRKLLDSFATRQRAFAAALTGALDQGDEASAERLAHTLNGVAATIGAVEVQALAVALERLIRDRAGRAAIDAALEPLAATLGALIAQLDLLPKPPQREPVAVDLGLLGKTCGKLIALLAASESEVVPRFELDAPLLEAAFPERFAPLALAIKAYDFEVAHRLLCEAASARSVQLD